MMRFQLPGFFMLLVFLSACGGRDLEWQPINNGVEVHLRGLSVVNDSIVWASGVAGTVVFTTDGGQSWNDVSVAGAEQLDFRDIHAVDQYQAWVLSSGEGVRIYRTDNGGQNWHLQYEDNRIEAFYDGFDFADGKRAVAYGDPLLGKMAVLTTDNGGEDWLGINTANLPEPLEGEAGFAASGTGIVVRGSTVWVATGGGPRSRILKSIDFGESWEAYDTPLSSGGPAGIFSIAFWNDLQGVAVGGNYTDSAKVDSNCATTLDGGATWQLVSETPPNGYRSCVAANNDGSLLIAVGRSGCDYSEDGGMSWSPFSTQGYYSVQFGSAFVWASGKGGKMARLKL